MNKRKSYLISDVPDWALQSYLNYLHQGMRDVYVEPSRRASLKESRSLKEEWIRFTGGDTMASIRGDKGHLGYGDLSKAAKARGILPQNLEDLRES